MCEEQYEYFKATVLMGGEEGILFEYQIAGLVPGSDLHHEDVSQWTNEDIIQLAVDLLNVDPELVQVIWD